MPSFLYICSKLCQTTSLLTWKVNIQKSVATSQMLVQIHCSCSYKSLTFKKMVTQYSDLENNPRICGHGEVVATDKTNLSFTLLLSHPPCNCLLTDFAVSCNIETLFPVNDLHGFPLQNDLVSFCGLLTDYVDFNATTHTPC